MGSPLPAVVAPELYLYEIVPVALTVIVPPAAVNSVLGTDRLISRVAVAVFGSLSIRAIALLPLVVAEDELPADEPAAIVTVTVALTLPSATLVVDIVFPAEGVVTLPELPSMLPPVIGVFPHAYETATDTPE